MLSGFQYKPFREEILLTNDFGMYCFLQHPIFDQVIQQKLDSDHPKYQELKEKLFIFDGSREEYIRTAEQYYREFNSFLFEPTNLLIMALTNECNNKCIYCQANGSKHRTAMTKEVADQIIRRVKEMPAKNITFEFQGGEPLLCFDLIQYIILQAEQQIPDKQISFTLVSNLILLTEEMADFFAAHQVSISTSLDGPKTLHDKNRPSFNGESSFDAVIRGKKLLEQRGIFSGAIQTTTAYSLPYPEEIVDLYTELGITQLFFRPLTRLGAAARRWNEIGYSADEYLAFYRKALFRILEKNLNGEKVTDYLLSIFLAKIFLGKSVNYMELRSPCGAAIGQLAFTANGNVYTCDEGRMIAETGDEAFLLGNVFDNGYEDWMNSNCCKAICSASLLDGLPGCHNCVYKPYCGVCPVVNYALNGSITSIVQERCKIYKGILDMLFEYIYDNDLSILQIFREWSERA